MVEKEKKIRKNRSPKEPEKVVKSIAKSENVEFAASVDSRINEEIKKDLNDLETHQENKEKKVVDENIAKVQNQQMKKIFITAGVFLLIFLIGFLVIYSIRNVNYRGVNMEVVKEGDLIFYKNAIHMFSATGNHVADYNIYFRNDPRKIKDIPYSGGQMIILNNIVLQTERGKDFQCNGDGIISVANFANLFGKAMYKNVIKNDTLGCDVNEDGWTSIQFAEGKETRIDKIGFSCYRISVSNCDILNATERFMYEYLVDVNQEGSIKISK